MEFSDLELKNMNLDFVEQYYTDKIKQYGVNSKGVDWKDSESQTLRFFQLLRGLKISIQDSILDFGCGYGALLQYLRTNHKIKSYYGYDISQAMLDEAQKLFPTESLAKWSKNFPVNQHFDYTILSGIFNVRNEQADEIWKEYIINTLQKINKISNKGFSFNILSIYSDVEYRKSYLYYADPLFFFDYCKKEISRFVCLYHDYPLYEFTISVLRSPYE